MPRVCTGPYVMAETLHKPVLFILQRSAKDTKFIEVPLTFFISALKVTLGLSSITARTTYFSNACADWTITSVIDKGKHCDQNRILERA